jgi:large subunit ribosomal protein L23
MALKLSIYDIILGPVVSDKAYKLNKQSKKLVLNVHPAANKPLVKEALEALFNVKLEKVNIAVRQGKLRKVRGFMVQGKTTKRAIVTLKPGYSLDLLDQAGVPMTSPTHDANTVQSV